MKKLSYEYNYDEALISLFVDGKCIDEWVCDGGDPEAEFKTFSLIYKSGYIDGLQRGIDSNE